jgi:glutamate dehydrogenase/leucine dehydrogenase
MIDYATDIEIDGVGFRHLITTRHGNVTARTAVHTNDMPKRLGGVRFVERGSVEEVAHLALGMSGKAAAADVPIDGLKCLIQCPDGVPASVSERATLVAAHLRLARRIDPDIIFGPDMLAAESVLSRVADDPGLARHVTGLDRSHGGIDIDGNGLTARGILEAIVIACSGMTTPRVSIQGFGAVGAELARMLPKGYVVSAICNQYGLIFNHRGLDVSRYYTAWRESGDSWIHSVTDQGVEQTDEIDSILSLPCDILVPAARTAVIACAEEIGYIREENPGVVAVERILDAGQPLMIAEAANFPVTEAAENLLEDTGTLILPDVLINCGGMIGCWHEYDNRSKLLADPSEYERSLEVCRSRIGEVVRRNTEAVLDGRRHGRHARDVARSCARRNTRSG